MSRASFFRAREEEEKRKRAPRTLFSPREREGRRLKVARSNPRSTGGHFISSLAARPGFRARETRRDFYSLSQHTLSLFLSLSLSGQQRDALLTKLNKLVYLSRDAFGAMAVYRGGTTTTTLPLDSLCDAMKILFEYPSPIALECADCHFLCRDGDVLWPL